jgi:hypothetical protein
MEILITLGLELVRGIKGGQRMTVSYKKRENVNITVI